MKFEAYKYKHSEKLKRKYGFTAEEVWDYYYENIEPYLAIITDFRIGDTVATHEQIRLALYLRKDMWRACKETFKELKQSLNAKQSIMKLKSQVDIQKGLRNTNFSNAKILEMQSIRYDDEYKPKGKEIELNIPRTIDIQFADKSIKDEELE